MKTNITGFFFSLALLGFIGSVGVGPTQAQESLLFGEPYSIGNGFTADGLHPEGSHFHSSNLEELPAGNPSIPDVQVAEVGGFFGDEEVRGLVEIDITGSSSAEMATLLFDVLDVSDLAGVPVGGIFGQDQLDGTINVLGYTGNNTEELSDYQISPTTALFDFDATTVSAGDTIEVDITDFYADLIANSADAAGFRLQVANAVDTTDPNTGAATFDNFRISLIPEPNSCFLVLFGLAVCLVTRSRR